MKLSRLDNNIRLLSFLGAIINGVGFYYALLKITAYFVVIAYWCLAHEEERVLNPQPTDSWILLHERIRQRTRAKPNGQYTDDT